MLPSGPGSFAGKSLIVYTGLVGKEGGWSEGEVRRFFHGLGETGAGRNFGSLDIYQGLLLYWRYTCISYLRKRKKEKGEKEAGAVIPSQGWTLDEELLDENDRPLS